MNTVHGDYPLVAKLGNGWLVLPLHHPTLGVLVIVPLRKNCTPSIWVSLRWHPKLLDHIIHGSGRSTAPYEKVATSWHL